MRSLDAGTQLSSSADPKVSRMQCHNVHRHTELVRICRRCMFTLSGFDRIKFGHETGMSCCKSVAYTVSHYVRNSYRMTPTPILDPCPDTVHRDL